MLQGIFNSLLKLRSFESFIKITNYDFGKVTVSSWFEYKSLINECNRHSVSFVIMF